MKEPKYWNLKAETSPAKQMAKEHDRKLRAALRYLKMHSEFYREKLRATNTYDLPLNDSSDLSKFPFTEKDELRRSQERLPPFGDFTTVSRDEIQRIHRTSGTTGRPVYLVLTRRDAALTAEVGARAAWTAGLRPEYTIIHCLNYCMWAGGVTDHLWLEETGAAVVPFGVGNSKLLLQTIHELGVDAIYSTPSYPKILAEIALGLDIDTKKLGVRLALLSGEPGAGLPSYRKMLEDTWGMEISDMYGLSDVLSAFAAQCEVKEGMHFLGQGVLHPELIDPDTGEGKEILGNEEGEFVFTNLERQAQPLLRYRTHDRVKIIASEKCECGRTGFKFKVLGRSDDMIIVRGVNVYTSAIQDMLLRLRPRTTGEFEVIIPSNEPLTHPRIRVESGENVPSMGQLKDDIEEQLKQRLYFTANVEIVPRGTLPTFDQKSRRIIRL